MEISNNRISAATGEQLTFLPEDFLVPPFQQQESDSERKIPATSGQKCLEQFGKFIRVTSWQRTFAALLIGKGAWSSTRCRLTWKLKVTKCSRFYFLLQVSEPLTKGKEFGLLHTPRPTMIVESNENFINRMGDRTKDSYPHLANQVADYVKKGLLPTPSAMMPGDADMDKLDARRQECKARKKNGNGFGASLNELAKKGLLPSPAARDFRSGFDPLSGKMESRMEHSRGVNLHEFIQRHHGDNFQLNPAFVEEMMGVPIGYTELNPSETPLSRK